MPVRKQSSDSHPPLSLSLLPIALLLTALIVVIVIDGAEAAQSISHFILLGAAIFTALLGLTCCHSSWRGIMKGVTESARQILPAIPILVFIATVSATWMLSGVVPTLIDYGLEILDPQWFLFITCAVCSVISVLSGSSWTTIATIGVAFMGIGTVLGYGEGWTAGAIISGAYFGDKVSPLSDTTVLASSSSGVELFTHIRYMMLTSTPAMLIALAVYALAGWLTPVSDIAQSTTMIESLQATFNITPLTLLIPLVTIFMIILRIKTVVTLAISSALGLAGIFLLQPQVISALGGSNWELTLQILLTDTQLTTGDNLLDSLVATGGIKGMLPTIYLVLCAMLFGGMMIGTGMLASITSAFTRRLHSARGTVSATVGSGLFLNACTGDQYLSIILGGNLYKNLYQRNNLEARLLSRSLEDSISVTSVLIPWNSCGVTQATVLGVATLTYLPFCVFNIASPLLSLLMAWTGYKIVKSNR